MAEVTVVKRVSNVSGSVRENIYVVDVGDEGDTLHPGLKVIYGVTSPSWGAWRPQIQQDAAGPFIVFGNTGGPIGGLRVTVTGT